MAPYVLYIEDDESTRYSVVRLLRRAGFTVVAPETGREALAHLDPAGDLPRVVMLDLVLPDLSGFHFLETLTNHPELNRIPVVVVTGSLWQGQRLQNFHPQEIIYKPFAPEQLVVTVQRLFNSVEPAGTVDQPA